MFPNTITGNDRPFGCPAIYTGTNSQCYFVHWHLNNARHNNAHPLTGMPCLTIIASYNFLIDETLVEPSQMSDSERISGWTSNDSDKCDINSVFHPRTTNRQKRKYQTMSVFPVADICFSMGLMK